jgi:hypothetical protein
VQTVAGAAASAWSDPSPVVTPGAARTPAKRVQDLALAIVVSQNNDIPFDALVKAIGGPPQVSLRNAIGKLRPNLNAPDAIRKARPAARELVGAAPARKP